MHCVQCVMNGALYSKIFPHLILGFRWNLHWLHQGQPAPQSTCHGLWCGGAQLWGTNRTQQSAIRVPWWSGRWADWKENVLLLALRLCEAAPHQLCDHHQRSHPGFAKEVHGFGQSVQVCTVQADAPRWTRWERLALLEKNTWLFCIYHRIYCCHWTIFIVSADLFQKLPLYERPLLLRLIAGPDLEQLSFVLKENETGEVEVRNYLPEECKKQNAEKVSVQANFLLCQHLLFFTLSSTVARVFYPWAAKLPCNPGERGGRASPGSGAKIQRIQTETTAGSATTWPLTLWPVTSSGQED